MVTFVNPKHDAGLQVECSLRGTSAKEVSAQILTHSDYNTFNAFDAPDLIAPQTHTIRIEAGSRLLRIFPPWRL